MNEQEACFSLRVVFNFSLPFLCKCEWMCVLGWSGVSKVSGEYMQICPNSSPQALDSLRFKGMSKESLLEGQKF